MYEPQVNDYIVWKNSIEGWVYFKCNEYITIEVNVRPKDSQNYKACTLHRNDRLLVLCYANQWKELTQTGYRENKYSETLISK